MNMGFVYNLCFRRRWKPTNRTSITVYSRVEQLNEFVYTVLFNVFDSSWISLAASLLGFGNGDHRWPIKILGSTQPLSGVPIDALWHSKTRVISPLSNADGPFFNFSQRLEHCKSLYLLHARYILVTVRILVVPSKTGGHRKPSCELGWHGPRPLQ